MTEAAAKALLPKPAPRNVAPIAARTVRLCMSLILYQKTILRGVKTILTRKLPTAGRMRCHRAGETALSMAGNREVFSDSLLCMITCHVMARRHFARRKQGLMVRRGMRKQCRPAVSPGPNTAIKEGRRMIQAAFSPAFPKGLADWEAAAGRNDPINIASWKRFRSRTGFSAL